MSILVFLNGAVVEESPYFQEVEEIIAVDGGFDKIPSYLKTKKIKIIGDLDSINHTTEGFEVIKFPREKDKSDFEITLQYLSENYKSKKIIVYGLTGGRFDHQLFNFFVLKNHLSINQYIAESEFETIFFSQGDLVVDKIKGHTFSIFPLEKLTGVTIKGSYYPLVNKSFDFYDSLTLSNVAIENLVSIKVKQGSFGLIVNKKTTR